MSEHASQTCLNCEACPTAQAAGHQEVIASIHYVCKSPQDSEDATARTQLPSVERIVSIDARFPPGSPRGSPMRIGHGPLAVDPVVMTLSSFTACCLVKRRARTLSHACGKSIQRFLQFTFGTNNLVKIVGRLAAGE